MTEVEFVIARNPDEGSSLPFLVRVPLGRDGIALKARGPGRARGRSRHD